MRTFRLAMAQINTTVGALDANTAKAIEYIDLAREAGADLVAFPELTITGYPPEDLLFRPQFLRDNVVSMRKVIAASDGIAVVVGFADGVDDVYNAAAVGHNGKLIGIYHKIFLPNYGVFDEYRYFRPGNHCPVFVIQGVNIGINICEDIWYSVGPTELQREAGAEVIININSSPYHMNKRQFREEMLAARAIDNDVYISYTNMVGGQDELVFDGGSMLIDKLGNLMAMGHQFAEDLVVADIELDGGFGQGRKTPRVVTKRGATLRGVKASKPIPVSPSPLNYVSHPSPPTRAPKIYEGIGEVYSALVLGTHDYVHKNGFSKVLIGLSGGIDSSVTAAISVDALGSQNVLGVAMPSRYSAETSLLDAKILAKNLGVDLWTIPIERAFSAYIKLLEEPFKETSMDITEENIQARIRGTLLMAISNKFGWLVLTTGNKSEIATGYTTLYGDLAGGFGVIKDVPKTLVYKLADYRNGLIGEKIIPQTIIDKPPTAELRPDQRDMDSLPPYDDLDPLLKSYVEEDQSYQDMVALGYDPSMLQRVIKLVDGSEYKRRQAPLGIKITPRAFGRDRRLPVVNRYKHF